MHSGLWRSRSSPSGSSPGAASHSGGRLGLADRRRESLSARGRALEEKLPLGHVASERRCTLEFLLRLTVPLELREQVPTNAREEVISLEGGLRSQVIDQPETFSRTESHSNSDSAIQLDHRRRRDRSQLVVKLRDPRPI